MISPQFRIPLPGTLYQIHHWLQTKSISNQPPETRNQQPSAPKASVLDSILVYPSVPESSKSTSKASLPKHLSGEQFIQYLQEKKGKKEQAELEKAERERKKKEA